MTLLSTWRDWKFDGPPFLLAGDECLLSESSTWSITHPSWESLTETGDFGAPGHDKRFHLSLVPLPFLGNVEQAKAVVLLLNPGLGPDDYFGELEVPGFRARLMDNLRQDFSKTQYPFVFLDPAISWHSGYSWWHGKFQRVIASLARSWNVNYAEARLHLAKLIACVELVPYHSAKYGLPGKIRAKLRSAELACDYVHRVLRPRTEAGEVLVVVSGR